MNLLRNADHTSKTKDYTLIKIYLKFYFLQIFIAIIINWSRTVGKNNYFENEEMIILM